MAKMNDFNVHRAAAFSGPNDCYRDTLRRIWDDTKPMLVVCMLNPSTADHMIDDPTVQALMHFARQWGYGGLLVVNLYNWRSPSPAAMRRAPARMGPSNHRATEDALVYAGDHDRPVLVAWGNHGDFEGAAGRFVERAVGHYQLPLICLGTTASGAPKHPMARGLHRIPRNQQPLPWQYRASK